MGSRFKKTGSPTITAPMIAATAVAPLPGLPGASLAPARRQLARGRWGSWGRSRQHGLICACA